MTLKDAIYSVVLLAVGFAIGWLVRPSYKVASTTSRIDTLIHFQPSVVRSTTTEFRTFTFPRLVFAPADTVERTVIVERGDKVDVTFPIERRVYADSTYRAVVSGAVVGDVHPTLEEIDVYSRSTTQTICVEPPKFRPYLSASIGKESIGAGAGVLLFNRHAVGLDYYYSERRHLLFLRYSIVFR